MKPTKKPAKDRKLFSQQAIADRSGCSQAQVSRLVARGELDEHIVDGKLLESAVEAVRKFITRDDEGSANDDEMARRLAVAETRLKEAQAQLRELELERESGRYVELDVVHRDAAGTAERVMAVLRALPQRTALALECACRSAAIVEKLISTEVERAIGEMRESMFIKPESEE